MSTHHHRGTLTGAKLSKCCVCYTKCPTMIVSNFGSSISVPSGSLQIPSNILSYSFRLLQSKFNYDLQVGGGLRDHFPKPRSLNHYTGVMVHPDLEVRPQAPPLHLAPFYCSGICLAQNIINLDSFDGAKCTESPPGIDFTQRTPTPALGAQRGDRWWGLALWL